MSIKSKQIAHTALQFSVMAVLIGMTLYVYNDWRTHRTLAAPESSPAQKKPQSTESPLQLPDHGVRGTIQVGPSGDIKQLGE